MKRLYTFIVLLGLVMGTLLAGCAKEEGTQPGVEKTNAVPPAASTNAAK